MVSTTCGPTSCISSSCSGVMLPSCSIVPIPVNTSLSTSTSESPYSMSTDTGAPVSVLIEYGLSEVLVERLVLTGIGTIEQLGSMTPEQLEERSEERRVGKEGRSR